MQFFYNLMCLCTFSRVLLKTTPKQTNDLVLLFVLCLDELYMTFLKRDFYVRNASFLYEIEDKKSCTIRWNWHIQASRKNRKNSKLRSSFDDTNWNLIRAEIGYKKGKEIGLLYGVWTYVERREYYAVGTWKLQFINQFSQSRHHLWSFWTKIHIEWASSFDLGIAYDSIRKMSNKDWFIQNWNLESKILLKIVGLVDNLRVFGGVGGTETSLRRYWD